MAASRRRCRSSSVIASVRTVDWRIARPIARAWPSFEQELGQPGDLEEEHVPAARELARAPAQALRHHRRMRAVEHGELARHRRPLHGDGPGDGAAPVVSDDRRIAFAEGVDQSLDVGDQLGHGVRRHAGGLLALVVAAQVGRDDAEALRQLGDLVAPGVPELGEPVQENDERTIAVDHAVQPHAVGAHLSVLERPSGRR